MERLKDYRQQAQKTENYYDLNHSEKEAQTTAQKVSAAIQKASNIIDVDFGNAKIKNLDGDTAGQQDMTKK